MGQIEIFQILKERRLAMDDRFFKVSDIKKLLRQKGYSGNSGVGIQLAQMERFEYLEAKRITKRGEHWRSFRLKSEYLEEKKRTE